MERLDRINNSLNMDLKELVLEFNKRVSSHRLVLEGVDHKVLIESASKPTLYDMRTLFTIMAAQASSGTLKNLCNEIVKTLAKMETYKIPNPRVPKLTNPSPAAFGYS